MALIVNTLNTDVPAFLLIIELQEVPNMYGKVLHRLSLRVEVVFEVELAIPRT